MNWFRRKPILRKCSYCGGTEFYEGPRGGLSVNVLCANKNCRHWFNDMGVMGFEDLHRVERTDGERTLEEAERRAAWDAEYLARLNEGRLAYANGLLKTVELLKDSPYSGYAEARNNIERLCGFLDAMAADVRALMAQPKRRDPKWSCPVHPNEHPNTNTSGRRWCPECGRSND